jgi:hypothetical protein
MRHHTVLMKRARVKDWCIGAIGMLLVLVLGIAVLGWLLSKPSGSGEAPGESATVGDGRPPDGTPPADLGEDGVWLRDLRLDAGTVVTVESMLRDVRAVGRDVVTRPDGLVAGRVTVDATVPFEVVADELGDRTTVRAAEGGQATVVRTVQALGREVRVVATGTVDVEAGRLVVEPRSIDIGGPDFLSDAIGSVVRRLMTIEHDVDGLPEGLVLRDVNVRRDGFRVKLAGDDVRLVP